MGHSLYTTRKYALTSTCACTLLLPLLLGVSSVYSCSKLTACEFARVPNLIQAQMVIPSVRGTNEGAMDGSSTFATNGQLQSKCRKASGAVLSAVRPITNSRVLLPEEEEEEHSSSSGGQGDD